MNIEDINLKGYKMSEPDHRDYQYAQVAPHAMFSASELPKKFVSPLYDMFAKNIRDQKTFGVCVGEGMAYLKMAHEAKNSPGADLVFSPLDAYAACKQLEGNVQEGSSPKTAVQVLKNRGIALEKTVPFNLLNDVTKLPTATQQILDEAKEFRIEAYAKVTTIDEIKSALYKQGPVIAGVLVYDNFLKPEQGKFISIPNGKYLGGHCITFLDWDDDLTCSFPDGTTAKGFVRFVNSWTNKFGDNGFGWISYDFIQGSFQDIPLRYMAEAWSTVDMITAPRPAIKPPTPVNPSPNNPVPTPVPQPQPPVPTPPKTKKDITIDLGDINGTVAYDKATNKITIKQN